MKKAFICLAISFVSLRGAHAQTFDVASIKPQTAGDTTFFVRPQVLASALGRPVIDRTGLGELYDLSLEWDDAPIQARDSIRELRFSTGQTCSRQGVA